MATIPLRSLQETRKQASRQALHAVSSEHLPHSNSPSSSSFIVNHISWDFTHFWAYTERFSVAEFLTRAEENSLFVLSLPPFVPYDYGMLIIPFPTAWYAWPVTRYASVRRCDTIIPTAAQRAQWLTAWRQLACHWTHICQSVTPESLPQD